MQTRVFPGWEMLIAVLSGGVQNAVAPGLPEHVSGVGACAPL